MGIGAHIPVTVAEIELIRITALSLLLDPANTTAILFFKHPASSTFLLQA
jgi:hypothetical protein